MIRSVGYVAIEVEDDDLDKRTYPEEWIGPYSVLCGRNGSFSVYELDIIRRSESSTQ